HEFEMLDHGMAGKPELAGDAHALVAGLDPGERHASVHHMAFDPVETPEEIEVPPGAAELAVGDGLKPPLLLPRDGALVPACLDRLGVRGGELALRALRPRRLQRRWPQQAAYVIGAERRLRSLHARTLLVFCRVAPQPRPRRPHRQSGAASP